MGVMGSIGASGQFQATPAEMRAVAGNVSSLLLNALSAALTVESMTLDPSAFARLGSPVAAASTAVHAERSRTLRALLSLFQQLNNNVTRSADMYATFDQNAASALGAGQAPAPTPAGSALGGPAAAPPGMGSIVASVAQQANTGASGTPPRTPTPTSVGPVLDYLAAAHLAQPGNAPPSSALSSPDSFAGWLNSNQNQAQLGLARVYAGGDALIRPGDVVVGDAGYGPVIGVAGPDGNLYNDGPFGLVSNLRSVRGVYRPITPQTALW
jgi:hypothetical protein